MSGAKIVIQTLADNGLDTCFSTTYTTDKHLDVAFSKSSKFRTVVTLFEGVATGAADGYARMAEKPAVVLSHNGFGLR